MDEQTRRIFMQNLNRYISEHGYNQADLARHMHVSTTTTARWCTGQAIPRIDKIQTICNWLGITKSDLLEENVKDEYYINKETAEIAQEVFNNPDLRVLFDAARDAKPENLRLAAEMLRRFKGGE